MEDRIKLEVGPRIWVERQPDGSWKRSADSPWFDDGISMHCAAGSEEALQYDGIVWMNEGMCDGE